MGADWPVIIVLGVFALMLLAFMVGVELGASGRLVRVDRTAERAEKRATRAERRADVLFNRAERLMAQVAADRQQEPKPHDLLP